ncbi:Thioredoxin-like 1-2, chloroplastic [Auxenochlorella protothecoides]|uniref:Thioredoxin-like 1-2, chloroplastic n=1 Tax=Auxenochlorella protothecoides TaxID=3075 RepID=A0A087SN19_AUXPR|nr:Thioredoxin-like 1-2, chloroplastic [Auxenochlorella protothecoides]KFM27123.1 Thioredoxin-like 1-2, chloroplastic [Auxenochlorella protothecoides]
MEGRLEHAALAVQEVLHGLRRRRELESQARAALDADSRWWQEGNHPNLITVLTSAQYKAALSSAASGQLVLINYFAPHCNGCRRLYPKFQQMVTCNPGVLFIKVNVDSEEMNDTCEALGVNRLPWFQLVRDGVGLASFSANLTTISRVRAQLKAHSSTPASDASPAPQDPTLGVELTAAAT